MWAEETKEGNISVWFHVDPHGGYRVPLGPMPSGQLLPGNRPGFKVTWLTASGQFWVSRQKELCFPYGTPPFPFMEPSR